MMKINNEPENKVVITTNFVVENNSTIVSVFYDEDGDWQFFGNEDVSEENAFLISVKQILSIDSTLNTLPNIRKGQTVIRNNINSPWEII